jgi:co-chaperonin GroES (HSP10)
MGKDKVNFTPYQTGILLYYKKKETKLIVDDSLLAESDLIYQVAAVGPKCDQVKVGDWVMINSPGVIIDVEGEKYVLIKEHQIFGVFNEEPKITETTTKMSETSDIKLDKTIEKAKKFNEKYNL